MEAFYKLAYDISCYYAFAAFFLYYVAEYKVSPLSFLVFFAACFFAVYAENMKKYGQAVQIGAFVLPIIPFLLENGIWGKLILMLPWVYMVVTVLRQGYDVSYRRFKKTFLCFFWIYTVVFVFFIAEEPVKGEIAMIVTVPFLLILLASGIFLLQLLRYRANSGDKKKLEKHQRRQLVVLMIAAIVLTVGNVVELLYVYVFFPLMKLVLDAEMALVVFVVSKLDRPLKPPKELGHTGDYKEFAEEIQKIYDNKETLWGKIPEKIQTYTSKELDYTPFIIVFCVLAAIVILAVMFGGKRIKRKPPAIEDEREDFYEEVAVKKVLRKRSLHPEIVIRFYYREFMKKSEKARHKLEASDTTKEILSKYQAWNPVSPEQKAEAEEITALYQKTRYSRAKIIHTDASRMKELVKGL